MRATALIALAAVSAAHPAAASEVPVLLEYPGCRFDSLGEVCASAGLRPDGGAHDSSPRAASYRLVFDRLVREGGARGANGLVVREHQAAFYSANGHRSPRPVHVSIRALAIRMDAPAACRLQPVGPSAMPERALHGPAADVVIEAKTPVL